MLNRLQAVNVVLVNVFVIMILQLGLNWQSAGCSTGSNFFQLAFIAVMLIRIIVQQAYLNKALKPQTYKALTLTTSGCLLTALGIYQTYNMATHSNEFDYDPHTKIGSLVCYQNRIVYVTEVICCFLTIIKDIVVVVMGNDSLPDSD